VTPVYVQSTHGQNSLINVLVAGYRVDALVAQQLKDATNSEFLFLTPTGVIASTLDPRATATMVQDLARKGERDRVTDGVIEYAWSQTTAPESERQPGGQDLRAAIV